MKYIDKLNYLINELLKEMPDYINQANSFDNTIIHREKLLRALMNVRTPSICSESFYKIQDEVLTEQMNNKGLVTIDDIDLVYDHLYLWQGDITRLQVDAIVNAANNQMLGCFIPLHGCIDNAIHSSSGVQLRNDCNDIMTEQGHLEATGDVKVTSGYNLPSKYVMHTVGPIIGHSISDNDRVLLASCYRSCLEKAIEMNLSSIAFCCISTGEYRFDNFEAAKIAIATVKDILDTTNSNIKVIFNVFKEIDYDIYKRLLG